MSSWNIRTRILIPQMFRLVLPSFVNELILVLKGSSIISVIAVTELTRAGQQIVAITFEPLNVYLICGALYLAMTLSLGLAGRAIESWLRTDKTERVHV
jgi:polar amino acid transport system permease protein